MEKIVIDRALTQEISSVKKAFNIIILLTFTPIVGMALFVLQIAFNIQFQRVDMTNPTVTASMFILAGVIALVDLKYCIFSKRNEYVILAYIIIAVAWAIASAFVFGPLINWERL